MKRNKGTPAGRVSGISITSFFPGGKWHFHSISPLCGICHGVF